MRKKLLAMLLAAVLLLGLLPMGALADGDEGDNEVTEPFIRVYKDSVADENFVCGGEGNRNSTNYTPGTTQTYIIKLLQSFWYIDGDVTVAPVDCGVTVVKNDNLTATISVPAETNCSFAVSYRFCVGNDQFGNGQVAFLTGNDQGGGDQGGDQGGSQVDIIDKGDGMTPFRLVGIGMDNMDVPLYPNGTLQIAPPTGEAFAFGFPMVFSLQMPANFTGGALLVNGQKVEADPNDDNTKPLHSITLDNDNGVLIVSIRAAALGSEPFELRLGFDMFDPTTGEVTESHIFSLTVTLGSGAIVTTPTDGEQEIALQRLKNQVVDSPVTFEYGGKTYIAGVGILWDDLGDTKRMDYLTNDSSNILTTDQGYERYYALGFFERRADGDYPVDEAMYTELVNKSSLSYTIIKFEDSQTTLSTTAQAIGWFAQAKKALLGPDQGGNWVFYLSGTLPDDTPLSEPQPVAVSTLYVKQNVIINVPDEGEGTVAWINAELEALVKTIAPGERSTFNLPAGTFPGVITVPTTLKGEVEFIGAGSYESASTTVLRGGIVARGKAEANSVIINHISFKGEGKTAENRGNDINCALVGGRINSFVNCTFTDYWIAVNCDAESRLFGGQQNNFTDNHYAMYIDWQTMNGGNLQMKFNLFKNNDYAIYINTFAPTSTIPVRMYSMLYCAFVDNGKDIGFAMANRNYFPYGNYFAHNGVVGAVTEGSVWTMPCFATCNTDVVWLNESCFAKLQNSGSGNSGGSGNNGSGDDSSLNERILANLLFNIYHDADDNIVFNYDNGADWGGMQYIPDSQLDCMEITLWDTTGDADAVIGTITFKEAEAE